MLPGLYVILGAIMGIIVYMLIRETQAKKEKERGQDKPPEQSPAPVAEEIPKKSASARFAAILTPAQKSQIIPIVTAPPKPTPEPTEQKQELEPEQKQKPKKRKNRLRENAKKKILNAFRTREVMNNHAVKQVLNASDQTINSYLDELEQEGKIKKIGTSGNFTSYALNQE